MGLYCEAVRQCICHWNKRWPRLLIRKKKKYVLVFFGQQIIAKTMREGERAVNRYPSFSHDVFLTKYCSCSKNACCGIQPHLLSSWQPRVLPINHKGKGHEIAAIHSQTPNGLVCPPRSTCTSPGHSRVLWWSVEIYCFVSTWPWPLHFFGHWFLMSPGTPFNDLERGSMNVLLSIKCRFMDKEI